MKRPNHSKYIIKYASRTKKDLAVILKTQTSTIDLWIKKDKIPQYALDIINQNPKTNPMDVLDTIDQAITWTQTFEKLWKKTIEYSETDNNLGILASKRNIETELLITLKEAGLTNFDELINECENYNAIAYRKPRKGENKWDVEGDACEFITILPTLNLIRNTLYNFDIYMSYHSTFIESTFSSRAFLNEILHNKPNHNHNIDRNHYIEKLFINFALARSEKQTKILTSNTIKKFKKSTIKKTKTFTDAIKKTATENNIPLYSELNSLTTKHTDELLDDIELYKFQKRHAPDKLIDIYKSYLEHSSKAQIIALDTICKEIDVDNISKITSELTHPNKTIQEAIDNLDFAHSRYIAILNKLGIDLSVVSEKMNTLEAN